MALDEKLKQHAFMVALIALTGTVAFGLGRLTTKQDDQQPVTIDYFQAVAAKQGGQTASAGLAAPGITGISTGQVVASSKGKKYHLPWCPGASAISEANKITFASADEARAAGYEPAANCKGLK